MRWGSIITGLACFLALIVGFALIVLVNTEKEPAVNTAKYVQPSPSPIQLQPPQTSLTGILSSLTGDVKKIPWDKEASQAAILRETLYQNDEILVPDNSSAGISLAGVGEINLSQYTSLLLGSLLPDRITLRQGEGKAEYRFEKSLVPVSIRVSPGILEIASGSAIVQNEPETVTINLTSGEAKLALVDTDNQTQVWKMSGSDSIEIDKNALTVVRY